MVVLSVYNEGVYNDGIYNLFSAPGDVAVKLDGKGQYLARTENLSVIDLGVYNEGVYNDSIYNFPKNVQGAYNEGIYNEGVYNFPAFNLGISNVWTLGFWVKPLAYKEHTTIFSIGDTDGKNEINISTTPVSAERPVAGKSPSEMRTLIKDENGTTIQHYSWPDWFREEEWIHTTLQWDGTDLNAFKDGTLTTTGVIFVNVAGTMTDTVRRISYGASAIAGSATFSGSLGHFGMWNSLLDSGEFETVVSGGFSTDLTVGSGTYTSSGTLQHYWRPGDDPNNIGKDYAVSGTVFNLNKARNIDCNNIVVDEPA